MFWLRSPRLRTPCVGCRCQRQPKSPTAYCSQHAMPLGSPVSLDCPACLLIRLSATVATSRHTTVSLQQSDTLTGRRPTCGPVPILCFLLPIVVYAFAGTPYSRCSSHDRPVATLSGHGTAGSAEAGSRRPCGCITHHKQVSNTLTCTAC